MVTCTCDPCHTPVRPAKTGTTSARRTCSFRSSTATRASRTAAATSGRRRGSRARSTCRPHAQKRRLGSVLASTAAVTPRLADAWPHPAARRLGPLGLRSSTHSAAEGLACPGTNRSLCSPGPKSRTLTASNPCRWSCALRTTSATTYGPTSTFRSASRCGTGSSAPGLLPREGGSSTRPLYTLPPRVMCVCVAMRGIKYIRHVLH